MTKPIEEYSGFELSKSILEALCKKVKSYEETRKCCYISHDIAITDDEYCETFDFNNWNDLMPLVVEYGVNLECFDIGTERQEFGGYYHKDENRIFSEGKNPQRALAECLLKVLENNSE